MVVNLETGGEPAKLFADAGSKRRYVHEGRPFEQREKLTAHQFSTADAQRL
jgi:hypothetical protein